MIDLKLTQGGTSSSLILSLTGSAGPQGVQGVQGPPGSGALIYASFIATNGQITFVLGTPPSDPTSLVLKINGVEYEDNTDYSISGATITWLNNQFSLEALDVMSTRYK